MFERPETKETALGALRLADSKYLEAARSMILLTKHLDIESHAPGWCVYFFSDSIRFANMLTKYKDAVLLPCHCTTRRLHFRCLQSQVGIRQ